MTFASRLVQLFLVFNALLHLRQLFFVICIALRILMASIHQQEQRSRHERIVELREEVDDLEAMELRLQSELDALPVDHDSTDSED